MNEQRMAAPVALTPPADNAAATASSDMATTPPPPTGFWQQRVIQNVVPFLSSLTVHASIILVGALTIKVVQVVSRPNVEVMTSAVDSAIEQTSFAEQTSWHGPSNDMLRQPLQDVDASVTDPSGWSQEKGADRASLMKGLEGEGDHADDGVIGVGSGTFGTGKKGKGPGDNGDGGPRAMFGPHSQTGGGPGIFRIGTQCKAMPRSVAYVCDASGSMLNNFDDLRRQISMSVTALKPVQFYNVIFFQGESAASASKSGLIQAFPENKRKTQSFLDDIAPSSTTDPIPALDLAFKQKPDLIWLLTDGDFPDNKAVLEFIRRHNPDHKTQVNTIAFVNRGDEYEQVLQTIAKENHGEFKYVNEETLAK